MRGLSYSHVTGTPEPPCVPLMSSDRVIIDAIKMAQRLLWQNLAPTHKLPDATTVMRLRDLVRSPAIQSALERSSDTFAAFTLRAVERVLSVAAGAHSRRFSARQRTRHRRAAAGSAVVGPVTGTASARPGIRPLR